MDKATLFIPCSKVTVLETTVGIWPLTEKAFCPKECLKTNKNIRQFYQKKKVEASLPDSQPLAFLGGSMNFRCPKIVISTT